MVKSAKGKNKKPLIIVIAIIIVAFVAGISVTMVMGGPVDKNSKDYEIVKVEEGSSTGQIAAMLEEKGMIKSSFFFKVKSKIGGYDGDYKAGQYAVSKSIKSKIGGYDGDYKAGQYAVSKSMSMKEQMELLCSGKTVGKMFTIPDGNNLDKDATLLEENNIITKEEFYDEVMNGEFDYEFLKDAPAGAERLEGFLYPETYQVDMDADAHTVIDTMLKQFDKVLTDEYYERAEELGLSVHEVMTVASIIEREAKTDEDKKNVASVIYNRLEVGMPLQMDSILAYITGEEKIKDWWIRRGL